jgi:hypothetical protein
MNSQAPDNDKPWMDALAGDSLATVQAALDSIAALPDVKRAQVRDLELFLRRRKAALERSAFDG